MRKFGRFLVISLVLLLVGLLLGACAAAPTPTPTSKPAAPATPTQPAKATPTPAAIRWEGGKLQPLPDGFPNKSLHLMAHQPAGAGVTDLTLRTLAKATAPFSPVPIVNDNRDEPNHLFGLFSQFEAQPGGTEGYYAGYFSGGTVARYITRDVGYDIKDVKIVVGLGGHGFPLIVNADAPWKNLKDFLDYAKANPKKARIAVGAAPGSMHQLAAFWLGKEAGADFTVITHTGSSEAVLTLLGGGAEAALPSIQVVPQYVKEGKIRVLATFSDHRAAVFPDAPTLKEQGINVAWFHPAGIGTHPKVPDLRVQWLYELYKKGAESPEFKKFMEDQGDELKIMSPPEYKALLDQALPKMEAIALDLGLHRTQAKKK